MSASIRHSPRLAPSWRGALYIVSGGIWLSGGLWLLFHYFFAEQGEFGPKTHPLEPWWLKLHGAFGFAAIWVFGLLWGIHVTAVWPRSRRRLSGGILTTIFAWLIVSGYLLYYLGDEGARSVVSALHWGIGLASPIGFVFHRLRPRRLLPPRSRIRKGTLGEIGCARIARFFQDAESRGFLSGFSFLVRRLRVRRPFSGLDP